MIKMDLSTKQVFLSGLLTWILTMGAGVFGYLVTVEKHSVRLDQIEQTITDRTPLVAVAHETIAKVNRHDLELQQHDSYLRHLTSEITRVELESSAVIPALEAVTSSNEKLVDVVASLQQQMARVETKLELLEK